MLRVCAQSRRSRATPLSYRGRSRAREQARGREDLRDEEALATVVSSCSIATAATCTACAASRPHLPFVRAAPASSMVAGERAGGDARRQRPGSWGCRLRGCGSWWPQEADRRELRSLRCDSIPVAAHAVGDRGGARARSGSDARRDRALAGHAPGGLRARVSRQGPGRASEAAGERLEREPADDRARPRAERAARLLRRTRAGRSASGASTCTERAPSERAGADLTNRSKEV